MTDTVQDEQPTPAPLPFRKPENGEIDWEEARFAYVNCSLTPKEFADAYGFPPQYVREKASRGGWNAEREAIAIEVEKAAQAALNAERAKELVDFNKADLTMAKAIRGMVAERIKQIKDQKAANPKMEISAMELRMLSSTVESAQRVGRLALGISTANHEVTGKDGKDLTAPTIIIGGPPEQGEPTGLGPDDADA